jgi:hypothetical protein
LIQKNDIKLTKLKIIHTAIFLLKNPASLDSLNLLSQKYQDHPNKEEAIKVLQSEFIFRLIKISQQDIIKEELNQLINAAEQSNFEEVVSILAAETKQYK